MTIKELQLKAALKQLASEVCPGHIYGPIYWSQINYHTSSSVACELCGLRVTLDEAEQNGWVHRFGKD